MLANPQLTFIREKIEGLKSAIFFNLSDSVLKFPTSIINITHVDEYGFVWFFAQRPKQHLKEFDMGFPVRLDFYRKGKPYFLQVTGRAWIVSDPEEMNTLDDMFEELDAPVIEDAVLVKVKMLKAEYHETQTSTRAASWWQNAVHAVHSWFRSSSGIYRQDDTYYLAS